MTIRFVLVLLAAAIVPAAAGDRSMAPHPEALPPDAVVVVNGAVIDGTGAPAIPDGLVAIRGGMILAVGPASDFIVPETATIIDARGGTILPGFIDAHVHGCSDPAIRRDFLVDGVTAVCDLGSPMGDMGRFSAHFAGSDEAARSIWSGPIITAPGGLPGAVLGAELNLEVATVEAARAAVRDLVNRGAEVIKIYLESRASGVTYPMLTDEQVRAIAEQTHERGLMLHAHCTKLAYLETAIECGVDVVEHIPLPPIDAERVAEIGARSPDSLAAAARRAVFPPGYDELLGRMAMRRMVLVPTFGRGPVGSLSRTENPQPIHEALIDAILEIVARYHAMGGTIAVGTDYNPGLPMKRGMPIEEVRFLLRAGLTPLEAIAAATKNAASAAGHAGKIGTLEPGAVADVIVVAGDPLAGIEALDDVRIVVKGGEIAFRAP